MEHLYFIPGTMCDERMWQPMLAAQQALFHPEYVTISNDDSIDKIVDDIARQLPQDKVNLLGFSLGGYLACAFAVRYPERVKRLFVVANMPCALPEAEVKERTRTVNWIKQHGYKGIPLKRILNLLAPRAHQNHEIQYLIRDMDQALGGKVLMQQLLATTQRIDLFETLASHSFDKYFCVGDSDNLVNVKQLKALNERDTKMALSVFEETGHMLPIEQPKAFITWLNRHIRA